MLNQHFYEYNDRFNYDMSIRKHLDLGTITETDAGLIRRYLENSMDKGKITSPRRANNVGHILIQWRKYISVPYDNLTLEELLRGKRNFMNNGRSLHGRAYAQNSQRHMVKVIKTFTKFLVRNKIIAPIDLEELQDIQPPDEDYHSISPKDILTVEEINRMIKSCDNNRDRAIIATLYETGCRIGELGRLTWGDFIMEPNIWQVRVDDTKTHQLREEVYMVTYLQYLVAHRNDLAEVNKSDFVFKARDGQPMSYPNLKRIIRKIATNAEIERQVDPKLFRTSRVTNMIIENYPTIVICKWIWGRPNSKMLTYYEKLASREVKKIALRMAGLESDDKMDEKLIAAGKPVKCVCGQVNAPGAKFCSNDGRPLTGEAAVEDETAEETFTRLMMDDNCFNKFCERRKKLKAGQ